MKGAERLASVALRFSILAVCICTTLGADADAVEDARATRSKHDLKSAAMVDECDELLSLERTREEHRSGGTNQGCC